jgi:hypothetical protein
MTVFGSEILFSGLDSNGLSGLWVTDGTANGTHELFAQATGATAAKDPQGLSPIDLTILNGKAFLVASTSLVAASCGKPTERRQARRC